MTAPPPRPPRALRAALLLLPAAALTSHAPAVAADPVTWRSDYNAARREAADAGRPMAVVLGTDECVYCRKLEATTLRDAAVAGMLAGQFVPLKVDANRQPKLAQALRVNLYPTTVLAAPDGKIIAFLEGYQDAATMAEHLKRAVTASAAAPLDVAARDYNEAAKAVAAADYPRAVTLLKGIVRDAAGQPVAGKAQQVLDGIERQAAGVLVRAKERHTAGHADAADALADLTRDYAGTQAATDAATVLAALVDRPENRDRQRSVRARELLAAAKEEFRTRRYSDCLDHCDQIAGRYVGTAEAKEATALAADVKGNPERLAAACEQMTERTAAMYLALAESWSQKGNGREAAACLEKVVSLSPGSRHAETAQATLTRLNGTNPTFPAGYRKPVPR